MRLHVLAVAALLASPASMPAAETVAVPDLVLEHPHASGRWTFKTPAGWTTAPVTGRPEMIEARGDGLVFRFVHLAGEQGFDSLHVTCMVERLAPENASSGDIKYEHDFLSGTVGERRALDSAFVVRYDAPIAGHRDWRQRNVTLVGGGMSLCAIGYAPAPVWKKSRSLRALHDAVLGSVSFR